MLPTSLSSGQLSQLANQTNQLASNISSNLLSLSTTVQQFDSIRKWLVKNHKKYFESEQPSNKVLSQFLCQFIQFQEEHLGKGAPKTTPAITRLPFEVLVDFQPGGALCHLFSIVFRLKHEQKIPKLDLSLFGKQSQLLDLCAQIEQSLVENQRLMYPTCYFRHELFVGEENQSLLMRLSEIVKRHKGQVVGKIEEADHVIYPSALDELNEPANRMDWIRVIKKRGKDSILIHRIFTPDSQDQWLSNVEVDDDVAGLNDSTNNTSGGDIWEVTANWLLDTDMYNEWMNQEDYEVDADSTNSDGKVKLKKPLKLLKTLDDLLKKSASKQIKRSPSPAPPLNKKPKSNMNSSSSSTRKRKHEEISSLNGNSNEASDLTKNMDAPPAQPHVEEVHVPKSLGIKKENPDFQPYRNGTLIDLDEENNHNNEENKDPSLSNHMNGHHMSNGNGIPFNNNTNNLNSQTSLSIEQQEACEQTHHIIVPSYSAWFDYTCIHEIEKRALPEYFNQKNKSKTPEIYMGYRNFMIDTYRLNPGEYLSGTACRRNLPGDVCAIMRVHAFLEQWGLINYQVDYEARAAPLGPPCTSHFTVLADTPSGLAPITGSRPTTGPSVTKQLVDFKKSTSTSQQILKSSQSTDDREATLSSTSSTTTTTIEKLNIDNFGLNTKIDKKQSAGAGNGLILGSGIMRSNEWSDQEILLLLEGLEMHKDDWNKVCEHVGTRTQDECILKFLQLPIEDPYLEPGSSQYTSASLGPLAYQPIPFSQAGNPVMSTVAFLASMVDPRVASAAAKAAIAEFTKMKDEVPPHTMETHLTNVAQAAKDGKKIDASYNIEQTGIAIVPDSTEATTEAAAESKPESSEATPEQQPAAMEVDPPGVVAADSTTSTPNEEGEPKEEAKPNEDEDIKEKKCSDEVKSAAAAETTELGTESSTVTLTTTTTTTTLSSTTTTTTIKETSAAGSSTNAISEAELKNAAASALAAAAVKARQLALNEEKKIKSTVSLLVETQLKKLEIKLRHFEELEAIMDRERENLEHQRQQLLQERQQFHCEQLRAAEFRQRQLAAQQLLNEGKLVVPAQVAVPQPPPQAVTPQMAPMQETAVSAPPASSTCASSSTSSIAAPVVAMPTSVSPALNVQQIPQPQPEITAQVVNAALVAPVNAYSPSPALPPPSSSPAIQQQQPAVALPQPAQHVQINQDNQIDAANKQPMQIIVNKQLVTSQAAPSPVSSPSLQQQQLQMQSMMPQMYPQAQQQPPMYVMPPQMMMPMAPTLNSPNPDLAKSVPTPPAQVPVVLPSTEVLAPQYQQPRATTPTQTNQTPAQVEAAPVQQPQSVPVPVPASMDTS